MKIDYVILSSDNTPMYYDFWPIVRDLWINIIGIKPIFVHICEEDKIIDNGDHIIHKFKSIEGINSGLQSQLSRMYVTKFYPDSVCLTSDIDMLPLTKKYFTEITLPYSDDSLVILSADAYPNKVRYPICYNVGKGKIFNEVLDLECDFKTYCERLKSFNWGWDSDELYFGKKVLEYDKPEKIIKLNRGWYQGRALNRIDRVVWHYEVDKLKKGQYYDCHSIRPYSKYKTEIDRLVNYINKSNMIYDN